MNWGKFDEALTALEQSSRALHDLALTYRKTPDAITFAHAKLARARANDALNALGRIEMLIPPPVHGRLPPPPPPPERAEQVVLLHLSRGTR